MKLSSKMKPLYIIKKKNNCHCQMQKTSRNLLASDFDVNSTIHTRLVFCFSYRDYKFVICCWCLLHFIISQLTLTFIRMPTCQEYKCMNTTGRTTKGKSFFKIPEPKNATEQKNTWTSEHLFIRTPIKGCFCIATHISFSRSSQENVWKKSATKGNSKAAGCMAANLLKTNFFTCIIKKFY